MKKNIPIGHIDNCQICGDKNLKTILSFGHQPIVQNYLTEEQLNQPENTFPLNFCYCTGCGLTQLDYIIDPKLVFPLNYPYRTGLTNMLIKNFYSLADTLGKKYHLISDDLIVDIGSNDGSLLKAFKDKGMKVLGIEPTAAAEDANNQGIRTIQGYFNEKIAKLAAKKYGKAKIITMTNAFAHINNLFEIIKGIEIMLDDDGIFVSESQYLLNMMQGLELDTIYHEHLRFYSLKPLLKFFSLTGFSLVEAETISAAGGSIRVYAKKGKHQASNNVNKLIKAEEAAGLYDIKKLKEYGQRMINAKKELLALLLNCQKKRARIVAIGSPARSNTLLGFANLDNHLIDYAGEKSGSPKIGLFTPGTHILVVDEKKLFVDQPDYALVLSWHIGKELMQLMRKLGFKGKFIMPLPRPRLVEKI